jgi:hypothetical protein
MKSLCQISMNILNIYSPYNPSIFTLYLNNSLISNLLPTTSLFASTQGAFLLGNLAV